MKKVLTSIGTLSYICCHIVLAFLDDARPDVF